MIGNYKAEKYASKSVLEIKYIMLLRGIDKDKRIRLFPDRYCKYKMLQLK